jgi:hypothetical protein
MNLRDTQTSTFEFLNCERLSVIPAKKKEVIDSKLPNVNCVSNIVKNRFIVYR